MQCNTSVKERTLPFVLLQPSVNRELSWRKKGFVLCWFDIRGRRLQRGWNPVLFPFLECYYSTILLEAFWHAQNCVSYQQPIESCLDRAIINWFHMMGCQSFGDSWLLFQELNYLIFWCSNQESSENIIGPWKQEDQRGDFNKTGRCNLCVPTWCLWTMALHSRIATWLLLNCIHNLYRCVRSW